MCQSKEDGGRRCDQASRFHTVKSSLQHKIRRQIREGNETQAADNQERLNLLLQAEKKYGEHVSLMDIPLDRPTQKLIGRLSDAGLDPVIVGGSVRDVIMGSVPKDIDIEVYGDNIDGIAKTLRKNGYKVDEVGKSFGVLKVGQRDGLDVDISVPRRDSLTGEGHRGFEVEMDDSLNFTEASDRRDFTMNAMGYSPVYKVAIDPHNGLQDLKDNKLKHVSQAFAEDPLRVLRGFQFASRYDMEMDPDTVSLSRKLLPRASELSKERLVSEWEKFYAKGQTPTKGLEVLKQTGWDSTVPHLASYNTASMASTTEKAVTLAHSRRNTVEGRVRIVSASMAAHMKESEAKDFIQATVNSKSEQATAIALSRRHPVEDDSSLRHLSRKLAVDKTSLDDYALVRESHGEDTRGWMSRARKLRVASAPRPALVMGRDILETTDRKPGPWVGQLTSAALTAQDNGVFSSKKDAIKWMKKELAVRN